MVQNVQTSAAAVIMMLLFAWGTPVFSAQPDSVTAQWEMLPILSYDSDAGFGYGVKTMLVDLFGANESFDIVLFNSTNGERWYRFVASYPDPERRQGTAYPFAADLTIDYDQWISNSFFGIGSGSKFGAREYYTREPLDLLLTVSRGYTATFILQMGIRHRSVRNRNFAANSILRTLPPSTNSTAAVMNSMLMNLRYDSRNSVVTPSAGSVVSGELEYAPRILGANTGFTKVAVSVQGYRRLFGRSVAAGRLTVQTISGNNLPVQSLLSVGGTNTARGIPQDRFLDRTAVTGNVEWRFPIVWRFGGVLGADAGRVAASPDRLSFREWSINAVTGLRLYMETFVVRLDIGFSRETSGIYLNFGELF